MTCFQSAVNYHLWRISSDKYSHPPLLNCLLSGSMKRVYMIYYFRGEFLISPASTHTEGGRLLVEGGGGGGRWQTNTKREMKYPNTLYTITGRNATVQSYNWFFFHFHFHFHDIVSFTEVHVTKISCLNCLFNENLSN